MGSGRWDSRDWAASRTSYSHTAKPSVDHIYTSRKLDAGLDPAKVILRESRDSAANPASTALIVGLDVTGSMDRVLDAMARTGLGTLVGAIYERQPITDPHIMIMGIGDFEHDNSPLQVTQFEAENAPLIRSRNVVSLKWHYRAYLARRASARHCIRLAARHLAQAEEGFAVLQPKEMA